MYVIIRTMKIEKGYLDKYTENFKKDSPITKSKGFVKKELYVSSKEKEYDIVSTHIYFEDKKAFYVWEGSPEHIQMHKERKQGNHVKPEEVIEVTRQAFDLVSTVNYG